MGRRAPQDDPGPRTGPGRAAPFFFFLLLVGWVSFALLGYALILWSPAFVDGIERGGDSFSDALYVAGSSLFTLGFGGDVTGATRAVVVAAGATGSGCSPW